MRTSLGLLLAAIVAAPAVAGAQVYYAPGPVYAPPPPPHVYIHQRVRWHRWRPTVVVNAPAPVWIAPAPMSPPPPPVYVAPPPPPIYVQPQPVYVQPPVYTPAPPVTYTAPAPVVIAKPALPMYESRFGLGATGEGLFTVDNGSNTGWGILGHMRYRTSRHLALELMAGYERSSDQNNFTRTDVPLTFGLMIPILGPEYALSPYLVGAVGLNFADLHLIDTDSFKLDDSRTQAVAQVGAGLELRLGHHFAINGDARLEGRWNLNDASPAIQSTSSVNGKPVQTVSDTVGLRIGVGASIYF